MAELPVGQRTCVQKLYARRFNDLRTNIMRRSPAMQNEHDQEGAAKGTWFI
jgi:hypothetical protein